MKLILPLLFVMTGLVFLPSMVSAQPVGVTSQEMPTIAVKNATENAGKSGGVGGVGSVVFIHPDGTSSASWAAGRALLVGPDDNLQWDLLPYMAVYRGHMADSLTATSNGGATTHATGLKVAADAFGRSAAAPRGHRLLDKNGRYVSVAIQAIDAGLPVGVVQTGVSVEPGSAVFLTDAMRRGAVEEITLGLIESNATVILGAGESQFLPVGQQGFHGQGTRKDGINVIELAQQRGYTVVYTAEQLAALPITTDKVLGLFARGHTFHDQSEEDLAARGLPLYEPTAPTVAQMTDYALRRLSRDGQRFLLVVEEEGTDNFGNKNNASGVLEAMRRADEAIGLVRRYVADHPQTLLLTAADSDASGMRLIGIPADSGREELKVLPTHDHNGAPVDGVGGTGTAPFIAAPDRAGRRLPFAIAWTTHHDVSGGVLVRAQGLNAQRVRGNMDNTELAGLMRLTLFGSDVNPYDATVSKGSE